MDATSLSATRSAPPTGARGLDPYLREIDRVVPLSADDEARGAFAIRELREAYWAALLDHAALVHRVYDDTVSHLGDLAQELPALGSASAAEREAVAAALVDLDPRCDVADRIAADLEAAWVERSRRFRDWVRTVQRRRVALHVARREFAAANLRLVLSVARRYRHNGFISFADLVQEGNIGLMLAIDRFDPRRGFRFSTYAVWWIRHAIMRAMTNSGRTVRVPSHVLELNARLRRARNAFEMEHQRDPTETELSELCGVRREKVERLGRVLLQPETEGARKLPESGAVDRLDLLAAPTQDPEDVIDGDARRVVLDRGLQRLRPMEWEILRMRFGLDGDAPMTLREIGEVYSLSRERIRQLQNRALGELRTALEAAGFDDATPSDWSTASAAKRPPIATMGTPAPG